MLFVLIQSPEFADVSFMKVIVQDCDTGKYLSTDGCWVAVKDSARDFFTLLRAYQFAKNKISGRFQVLLHCPEDQYTACIIDGVGMAASQAEPTPVPISIQSVTSLSTSARRTSPIRPRPASSYTCRLNWVGNPLN